MKYLLMTILMVTSQLLIAQDQMYNVCPLKVGDPIPEVNIVNGKNEVVGLKALSTEKPVVAIFYRGAWCGYCTKHLAELNDIKSDIEALGYQVIGITTDRVEKLAISSEKANSEIEVYSDAKVEAIRAFGLDWKLDDELYNKYKSDYKLDLEEWSGEDHHSLPVPAIFVLADDAVQFQYVNPNYRTRLKPETLLAILKTL